MAQTNSSVTPKTMPTSGGATFWWVLSISALLFIGSLLIFGLFSYGTAIVTIVVGLFWHFCTYDGVQEYHSQDMKNRVTGKLRAVFPGFGLKSIFETMVGDPTSLKKELHKTKEINVKSKSNGMVHIKFAFSIGPDTEGNPGEDIIGYNSYEHHTVEGVFESLAAAMITDWYQKNDNVFAYDKSVVVGKIFGDHHHPSPQVQEFMDKYKARTHVIIEDADPDKEVQKFDNALAAMQRIAAMKKVLTKAKVANPEQFIKYEVYKENTGEMVHMVYFEGLPEGLTNVSIMGGGLGSMGKASKGKTSNKQNNP